jgi:hypothetical protein
MGAVSLMVSSVEVREGFDLDCWLRDGGFCRLKRYAMSALSLYCCKTNLGPEARNAVLN